MLTWLFCGLHEANWRMSGIIFRNSFTVVCNDDDDATAIHTCILKVHILAVVCVLQAVCHDFQLHYLLTYSHVWLGDVNFHLWVIDLTGQTVTHHLREIPNVRENSGDTFVTHTLYFFDFFSSPCQTVS